MTEKEKSYAGLLYQPADPELAADRDVTAKKLYEYNQLHPLDREARQAAIREILGKTGKNCVVEQPLFCTYGYNTTVGDNFFLNVNCKLMDSGKITIGNNVFIAPNVCIITEEHAMDVEQRLAGLEYTHPVTIGGQCVDLHRRPGPAGGHHRRQLRHWRWQRSHQGHPAQQPGGRQSLPGSSAPWSRARQGRVRCKERCSPAGLLQGCFCIESYRTLGRRKCYAKTRRTRPGRAGISPASPAAPAGRAPRALPPGRMRLFPLCHRRPGRCGGRFLLLSCNQGETLPLLHSTTKRGGPLGSPLFVL